MNTEIIAETIKIIGAVGVIASVLYLAIQIRQNTRSERSSTQQQLTDRIHNRLLLVATHPDLAALIAADWSTTEFTDVERVQIRYWLAAIIADIKGIHAQYKLGLVTKSALHGRITIIKQGVFKTEIAVSTWNNVKGESEPDFINWFEKHIINA
jgi:hypothetical protein